METAYKKSFLKDLQKLPADVRAQIEAFAFHETPSAASLNALGSIAKITGFPTYFRKTVWQLPCGV